MKWKILIVTMLMCFSSAAFADMDTAARRDYLTFCLLGGGYSVQGREPLVEDGKGKVDIQRTTKNWTDSFSKPEDKLKAAELMTSCLKGILDSYNRKGAQILPRNSDFVDLFISASPIEHMKGLMCANEDLKSEFTFSYMLRQKFNNIDQNTKNIISSFINNYSKNLFGGAGNESLLKEIMQINPNEINCGVERICQIRGTVPVNIKTNVLKLFDAPMRQVEVLAGQCSGKVGFVNERFIDF